MNAFSSLERTPKRRSSLIAASAMVALITLIAWLPMTWQEQTAFGCAVVLASLGVNRFFKGDRTTHMLMLISVCVTMRYAWFRVASLIHYLHSPWSAPDVIDASFMVLLLCAELYSFTILLLGYMQGIAPLKRRPVPMPKDASTWPMVDVFIPTYNEPLELVRTTALATTLIDWPADKLRIVILDDGEREEFRAFSEEAGIDYVARTEHSHAKAGNINHALTMSEAEYIAIFDSDHVPTRSFLQMTVGWFLRDEKLGMLQTPHHFYSPDPVERNLDHFRTVPNEGELFYGVIQDGNDLWNATFFCGSCAVIRRSALEEIGGIAVETVTEDAHTSLRMQIKGWNTAYLNMVQAAGLATESVSGHVRQRTRWARGMIQVLRTDNPLFARGLKPAQRLCYLNAMLHFMYAAPRLIFLASPLLYLLLGKLNMPGYWLTILVFAAPHLVLSTLTNSRIQGQKRHTFWNEVYETILSPYILFPTWLALVNPRYGTFNVTTKGSQQDDHFDVRIGWPFLVMLLLNVLGLAMAVPRYLYWNADHRGTVLMNVAWTMFNIVILGVTVAVCYERKQRRSAVRITARIPVTVTGNGETRNAFSQNVSSTGMALLLSGKWRRDQEINIAFDESPQAPPIRARVTGQAGNLVRVQFEDLSIEEQLTLTAVLYSRADRWLDWANGRQGDNLVRSFARVLAASLRGLGVALTIPFQKSEKPAGSSGSVAAAATRTAALLFAIAIFTGTSFGATPPSRLEGARTEEVHYAIAGSTQGTGILLNRHMPSTSVRIVLPSTLLIENSMLALRYSFPAGTRPDAATLRVLLNGNVIASSTPTTSELSVGASNVTIPLPVDVFVQDSRLQFEFPSAMKAACQVGASTGHSSWLRIDPASGIEVHGSRLKLADDLNLLPEPFVRRGMGAETPVPVVFADNPDATMLRAAGIAASWFGVQAQDRAPKFDVKIGELPQGNATVLLAGSQSIGGVQASDAGLVRITANPNDPLGKLLIFSAPSEDKLLELTRSFAAGQLKLEGSEARETGFVMPDPRKADDAPAWVQGNRVPLADVAGGQALRAGADGAELYLRFAPDLNFGAQNDSYLSLHYVTGADALSPMSNIAVMLNEAKANSIPLRSSATGSMQTANIPLGELPFLFRNTLSARLYPVAQNADPCTPVPPNFKASISGGSYLDLGDASHLARLPELRSFSNAGFPFTRFADLGQTAVLLPERPETAAIALYLDLLGYFGAQTGYPALRVTVDTIGNAAQYSDKDLLALGSYSDAVRIDGLTASLTAKPWAADAPLTTWAAWMLSGRKLLHLSDSGLDTVSSEAASAQALIEGAKSPYGHGRSLVVVLGRSPDVLAAMTAPLLEAMPLDLIHGRASFWTGAGFRSYELSGQNYLVGDAPLAQRLEYWMAFHPWLPALIVLIACALAGIWIQSWVQYRRRYRLEKQPVLAR